MTYKEARDWLGEAEFLDLHCTNVDKPSQDMQAVDKAIKALNKEIPDGLHWISVAPDTSGYTDTYKCPICNYIAYTHSETIKCNYEYCPNCGQRIEV